MKKTLLFTLLSLLLLANGKLMAAQLSGNYTIDPAGTPSTTVFKDFVSAYNFLTSATARPDGGPVNSTPFGVSGPVVFNVTNGVYNFASQFTIAAITGASATNTITFDGGNGNAANVVLQGNINNGVLMQLNAAQFVKLYNLTINNLAPSASYACALHLVNAARSEVKKCIISVPAAYNATSFNRALMISGSTSFTSATSMLTSVDSIIVDSNVISNGYYTVGAYGSTTVNTNNGFSFVGNTINGAYAFGMQLNYIQLKVNYNTVNMLTTMANNYGIAVDNTVISTGTYQHEIIGNKITNATSYGIYLSNCYNSNGAGTNRTKVYNNMISTAGGTTSCYGLYSNSGLYTDFYHNTISHNVPTTNAQYAALFVNGTGCNIRNNILSFTSTTGVGLPLYCSTAPLTLSHNNYFNAAGTNLLYNASSTFTIANYTTPSPNSTNTNVQFVSRTNLSLADPCFKIAGLNLTANVPLDINRITRNAAGPAMGADEPAALTNDLAVKALVSPVIPFASGNQPITIQVKNVGSNIVNIADFSFAINNFPQGNATLASPLAACASTNVTFGSNYNFVANTGYALSAYSSSPNGVPDANLNNDTLKTESIGALMSGTYTIDQGSAPSTTNFTSFTAAIAALQTRGIGAAVTFNVMGTTPYVEQIAIPPIVGASATNTITFDGGTGNATNRFLSFNFPGTPTSYAIFQLNGADYVTIKNITLRSTSTNFGYGVLFSNQADFNVIDNCIIDLGTITSTTADYSSGITFSSNPLSVSNTGNHGANNIISNCQILGSATGGPYRGINLYGNTSAIYSNNNNQFINNNIADFLESGIYAIYYLSGTVIRGNTISKPNRTLNTTFYGMMLQSNFQNTIIEGNKILNPFGGALTSSSSAYGIYVSGSANLVNNVVRNNAIYQFNGNGPHYGIYDGSNYGGLAIYHNTVSFDFATAKTNANADYGIYVQMGTTSTAYTKDIRNNMVTITRAGIAGSNRYGLYLQDAFPNLISNNNLWLITGAVGNNITTFQVGVNYFSLAAWKASNNNLYDQNSVSFDPVYTSVITNLMPTSCGVDNKGVSIASVTTDINGNTRGATPDIGAYEFTTAPVANNAAIVGFDVTTTGLCAGGVNAVITLNNAGTAPLTAAKIDWTVNNVAQTQAVWSGSLAPGASTSVTLGIANFVANNSNSIRAYITEANATTDGCANNDTASVTALSSMSGVYTINAAGSGSSNFTTFTLAVAALSSRGVCGPVTFNVATGKYTEQIVIPFISGASAINTITFDGGAANLDTITFSSSGTTTKHTIRFDNAQWVNLRNMTIIAAGTQAWPVHLFNNSSNIQVRKCAILCTQTLTNQTSTNYVGVVVSNSTSSLTSSTNSFNVDIDSNTITNGAVSVSFYGSSTVGLNQGINVRNNVMDSAATNGITFTYCTSYKLNNNTINMRAANGFSTTSVGITTQNGATTTTSNMQINNNKIISSAQIGILVSASGGSATTQRPQMINNAIGGGFNNTTALGIQVTSGLYWDIWFNSININNAATGATSACLYLSNGTASFMDIRNNNFAVTNTTATGAVCYRSVSSATTNALNYNNYYKAGATVSTTIAVVLGTNLTPANFTTSGGGANSINQNSMFTNNLNLLPTVNTNKGVQLAQVATDINGNARNIPPDLGAYEVASSALIDLAAYTLVTPDSTLPMGNHNVSVTVRNFGTTTITSFNLRHSVNNSNIKDTAITGVSLAQGASMVINMGAGKQATFGMMANTFKVYVDMPNGSTDNQPLNDTITIGPRFPSMSGVFTIDPLGSGQNNFTTFNAAVTALNSGGVSAAVTFNVAATTFNEQIQLFAIPGASATNTVKFVGSNMSNCTLNFAGAASPNHYTIRLNGSQYVSFENMTLSGGGTTANWVVHLFNASNCTVKNCRVTIGGSAPNSTSSAYSGIIANGNITQGNETSASSTLHNNVIDSNIIEHAYYGIVIASGLGTNVNYIRANNISSIYQFGLYLSGQQCYKVLGNTLTMRTGNASSYGMYIVSATATTPLFSEVKNNTLLNATYYGMAFISTSGSNLSATMGEMYNNMLSGGFGNQNGTGGIYMNSASNWRVWHNTVNFDGVSNGSALFLQNGSANDVRNNIFVVRNATATAALPVILTPATAAATFNYNNAYNAASSNLYSIAGNIYTSSNYLAAFPTGAGLNAKNMNPAFISATDAHIAEACMNGENLSITTDIDGNTRSSTPDMGADEMNSVPALDANVVKVNAPTFPFVAGNQPINITIQNGGNTTLTALTLGYSVNSGPATTQNWTGTLAPCDTMNFTFTANHNFGSGPNVLKVYAASPNSGVDANNLNDTITTTPFCSGMNGAYTINPAGSGASNFTTFGAAVSALTCGGLAGPVVFNVSNGTYNEQVNLIPVQGASPTNTIAFKSATGIASGVTVNFAPGLENFVVNLNGADYVTFEKITFTNTNTSGSYFNVANLANAANNNTFRGCVFNNSLPNNGNLFNVNGSTDNNNVLVSNTFVGGSNGINWNGNSSNYPVNNQIDSNTFINQISNGMTLSYGNDYKIRYNTITQSATITTFYGIQAHQLYLNARIIGNSIYVNSTTSTTYGISTNNFNSNGNASNRALVANNMIRIGTAATTGSIYGIATSGVYFVDYINNSVLVNSTSTTTNAYYGGSTTASNIFANNIFQCGLANANNFAFNSIGSTVATFIATNTINYNNYYVNNGNIGRFSSGLHATLAAWKIATTQDVNSVNYRTDFVGQNDLHNTTACLDNTGSNAYLALVATDVDGQSRSVTTPDIGADEFTAQAFDVRVLRISSPISYNVAPQTVKAWIQNAGTTQVTSANIAYRLNGGALVSQSFTGLTLNACDSVEVTFTNQLSIPTGYSIVSAFVNGNINGSNADGVQLNDTTVIAFCTSLSGNFTINAGASQSATNFQTFSSAVAAMKSCGLSGAVNFTVAAGTYNEQVVIANIPGVSATNTITFDGVDSSNRVLTFAPTVSAARYVLLIDSCNYVTIKNLKIMPTGTTYGWGVAIRGNVTHPSDYVTIRKCAIPLQVLASTAYAGIVFSGSTTSLTTTGVYAEWATIDSNTISGGYLAISHNGVSTVQHTRGTVIRANKINNAYQYGMYLVNQADIGVIGNNFLNTGRSSSVIASPTSIYLNNTDSFEVSKNTVYNQTGNNALYVGNSPGTLTDPNIISNNMFQVGEGANNVTVINISSANNTHFYHNSLYATTAASSTGNTALYCVSSSNLIALNNNFVTQFSNANYMVFYPAASFTLSNYNNYFGGAMYAGSQTSINAFANGLYLGSDTNSKSVNPNFVGINNLHTPTTALLDNAGTPVALVTTDIDGQTRSATTPDIGADEFTAPTENTGVTAIISPSNPLTAGVNEVHVVIKNFGASVLTTDSVFYQVGSTVHRRLWTGSLSSNAIDTVRFTATSGPSNSDQRYTFPTGSSLIKAWTSYPNGIADVSNNDDTATVSVCTGISGTYTIDAAGSGPTNFTTISAAANTLQCGITGPVVFNIAPGTYTEQFIINPIPGSSSTNTVMFKSATNVASSVIVQYNATTAPSNYLVRLAGADYVTFDRMTFTAQNTTNGIVFDMATYNAIDKPSNVTISNCNINGTGQNTPVGLSLIYVPVDLQNLTITGNTFSRGSNAIYFSGNTTYPYTDGLQITNNIIGTTNTDAPYSTGIYLYYARHAVVTGNQIFSSAYTNYYGINIQSLSGKIKINRNKINVTNGVYGISTYFVNTNNETDTAEFNNNAIAVGGTTTSVGIYHNYSSNCNFYNNSIYNYSSSTGSSAIRTFGVSTFYSKNRFVNNVLYSTVGYAFYVDGNSTLNAKAMVETSNYNNLFTGGTNIGNIFGIGNITTFAQFKDSIYMGSDANSVSGNPAFTSTTNLMPNVNVSSNWSSNGMGVQLASVPTDINGAARSTALSTKAPDLGAYEFNPLLTNIPNLTTTGTHAPSAAESFWFYGRKVATINWAAGGTLPTLAPKFVPGTWPDTAGTGLVNAKYFSCYWDINATGGSGYTYDMMLYFDSAATGTVSSQSSIRMAKKDISGWNNLTGSSTVFVNGDSLLATGLTSFSDFTGTDLSNPLPVKLITFNAQKQDNGVQINWLTAMEINHAKFELERSVNNSTFENINTTTGNGNSNRVRNYGYFDKDADILFAQTPVLYYRLKQVDVNGRFEYSNTVLVESKNIKNNTFIVYPNPTKDVITVKGLLQKAVVRDMLGNEVLHMQHDGTLNVSGLPQGVYFIHSGSLVQKFVKN